MKKIFKFEIKWDALRSKDESYVRARSMFSNQSLKRHVLKIKRYKNFRGGTARAGWWDYSSNAAYFVTMCIKNRKHYFGEVENGSMQLSALGKAAEACWKAIPEHFPFVEIGAFVFMPDHMHGIIFINKMDEQVSNSLKLDSRKEDLIIFSPKKRADTLFLFNQFGPQSKNLASIVRGFKVGVTKASKTVCPKFKWQPLYYDRIIRNEFEYWRIE